MLTEEEAKTKWCPMQRHCESAVGGSYNRPASGGFGCIASDCMMWQQASSETEDHELLELPGAEKPPGFVDYDTPNPDGSRWSSVLTVGDDKVKWIRYSVIKRGYCGLSGKPDGGY